MDEFNQEALKPCPFCGGKAYGSRNMEELPDPDSLYHGYQVHCTECFTVSNTCYDTRMATEWWNRRTVEADKDRLKDAVATLWADLYQMQKRAEDAEDAELERKLDLAENRGRGLKSLLVGFPGREVK